MVNYYFKIPWREGKKQANSHEYDNDMNEIVNVFVIDGGRDTMRRQLAHGVSNKYTWMNVSSMYVAVIGCHCPGGMRKGGWSAA